MNIFPIGRPSRCILCLAPVGNALAFCNDCLGDLPWRRPGLPGPQGIVLEGAFWFEPPINWLIHEVKISKNAAICRHLGHLLAARLGFIPGPAPVVCPIPLRWGREVLRGFNQSLLLAHAVATHFAWRLESGWLARVGEGTQQKLLGRSARLGLGAETFRAKDAVAGERILLVDDVSTTGATLRAARQSLLSRGAVEVTACVCAVVR